MAAPDSVSLRTRGNDYFGQHEYFRAADLYRQAIDACDPSDTAQLSTIYTNLAFAETYIEETPNAVTSATRAIELNPENVKAYIRRAAALVAQQAWKEAYDDYRVAIQKLLTAGQAAQANALRKPANECKARFTASNLRKAMANDEVATPVGVEAIPEVPVELPEFTREYAQTLTESMAQSPEARPHAAVFREMARRARAVFLPLPNIVRLSPRGVIRVVGDTHGQYQDFVMIFKRYGWPSAENPYLFNGDYVDRGSLGVEILASLIAWKLAEPEGVFLNRGNHETDSMNSLYGFEGECKKKYNGRVFDEVTRMFNSLPLGHILGGQVIVVHGGLFGERSGTLASLEKENRDRQPPEGGAMNDILWSDPMDNVGYAPSPRGTTSTFGPDVTERFLREQGLKLLIRSHQVQEEGYSIMHHGKCITVFSAPNYCGQMRNKGAVVKLTFADDGELTSTEFEQFEASPIPAGYQPMKYSSGFF
jgi:serine/threonine-protein phosphatase 5